MLAKPQKQKLWHMSLRCPPHARGKTSCPSPTSVFMMGCCMWPQMAAREKTLVNCQAWRLREREGRGGHSNPLCFESSVLCDSKFTSAHHVQWVALAWSQGEQVPGHRYSLSAEVGASEWAQGRKQEQELGQCLSLFLVPSFSRSLSHSQSQTHTPSLPQPTSHSHCVFNPGLFCGRIPHEDSRFCGSLFLPGPAMLFCHPFSFQFAWKCLHVPVCLCVASMPPSSLCERAYAHYAHTHIHIWVKRHTIPSEPGNARDYGKRCDYYQDFYFLLSPPPPHHLFSTNTQ